MELLILLLISLGIVGWGMLLHFTMGILFDMFDDTALLSKVGEYLLDKRDRGSKLAQAVVCIYCWNFHLTTLACLVIYPLGILPLWTLFIIYPITFLIRWKL